MGAVFQILLLLLFSTGSGSNNRCGSLSFPQTTLHCCYLPQSRWCNNGAHHQQVLLQNQIPASIGQTSLDGENLIFHFTAAALLGCQIGV